jgi:hypothetical protein
MAPSMAAATARATSVDGAWVADDQVSTRTVS